MPSVIRGNVYKNWFGYCWTQLSPLTCTAFYWQLENKIIAMVSCLNQHCYLHFFSCCWTQKRMSGDIMSMLKPHHGIFHHFIRWCLSNLWVNVHLLYICWGLNELKGVKGFQAFQRMIGQGKLYIQVNFDPKQ